MSEIPQIKFALSDDKSSVVITVNANDVTFKTQELEHFIGWLGVIRSQMSPGVPTGISEGMSVSQLSHLFLGHRDGLTPLPIESGAVVAARSEMFGWMEFTADADFCRGLISWMNTKATPQPTAPPV
ncbi:hypothetical protein BH11PSE11_BH11PSE11_06340 [soil metagenome]